MFPEIAVLFCRSSLFMEAREKISNENNVYLIIFFYTYSESKYQENFHKFYCFRKFCKTNPFQDGVRHKTFAKDEKIK